jgi:hypothetical protein
VASDVAVPWDIAYIIEFLKPKLGDHNAEYLTGLVAALNYRAKIADFERFLAWRNQSSIPLDVPWPEPIHRPLRCTRHHQYAGAGGRHRRIHPRALRD